MTSSDVTDREFATMEYAEEARARWGHTEAWRESARRTRGYSDEDWVRVRAESDEVYERMAALLAEGARPESAAARELAEAHRRHIDRWFYPCGYDAHRGLAELYTSDPRFAEHFECRREGLSAFVADAIRANAARADARHERDG